MKLRITKKTIAIAAILTAGLAQAQEPVSDRGVIYQLIPVSPRTATFRFSWGERAAVVGYRNAVGILLFNKERNRIFHVAGSDDTGTWPDLSSFPATGWGRERERQNSAAPSLRVEETPHYSRDDYSRRWFVMPSPNWVLQFTRGHLSNLDQLEAPKNIQRTAFSATYRNQFDEGVWQTTFAWGRHSSNTSPNTIGYLAESLLQLGKVHTVFGRMERVRSDDLLPDSALLQQDVKVNKLTAGYYYDIAHGTGNRVDVGGMVSRYSAPANVSSIYGRNPTAVFLFIRMQLH